MRRKLLAAVSAAALACGVAPPAHALFGAGDIVSDPGSYVNQATEIGKLVAQLNQLQQQYQVMTQQYAAIAHLPQNIEGIASSLTTGGLRNAMPSVTQLGTLLDGTDAGSWGGLASGYNDRDRYADPTGDDPGAVEMLKQRSGLANIQAVATNNIQSLQQRAASLGDFLGSIGSSPDIQQTAAIQARLQLEQNFVATQQAQATNLQVLANAQAQVSQQRANEASRQSAEEWRNQTAGVWNGQ